MKGSFEKLVRGDVENAVDAEERYILGGIEGYLYFKVLEQA